MVKRTASSGSGQGIDIALSVDHTYSTAPVIEAVKAELQVIAQKLSRVPGMRFAVIDHGDYESRPYYNVLDFTDDIGVVQRHLQQIRPDGGSGRGANYAQALQAARQLNWQAGKSRVLIMCGDEIPRPSNLYTGSFRVEADDEVDLLAEMKVKIFGVQLLGNRHATSFYRDDLAGRTGGRYLPLAQMYQAPMMVIGIGLFEESADLFEDFAAEVAGSREFTYNVEDLFDALRGRAPASAKRRRAGARTGGLPPGVIEMDPDRFQIMKVRGPEEWKIAQFVRDNNLEFKSGRGFYLHDFRVEEVQDYKEIVLRDVITGKWYAEKNAKGREGIRSMIGISTTSTVKLQPNPLPGYEVWIQSTSSNRTLNRGGRSTLFAYQVPDPDAPAESTSAAALKKKWNKTR